MDKRPLQTDEQLRGLAEPPLPGYDDALLGVECAWPTPEREELLAQY